MFSSSVQAPSFSPLSCGKSSTQFARAQGGADDYHFESSVYSYRSVPFLPSSPSASPLEVPRSIMGLRRGITRSFLNQETFTMGSRQTRVAAPRARASPPLVGFFPTQFSRLVRSGLFSNRSLLTTLGAISRRGAITPATTLKVSPNRITDCRDHG